VWLRGFPDMDRRKAALEAFYGGSVWKSHREAANATMIDVDDVLLLRPLPGTTGFEAQPPRPAPGAQAPASVVVATVCSLAGPADVAAIEAALLPALADTASPPLAYFVEEPSENTFPGLPVRTGEHVLVWLQRFEVDVDVVGDVRIAESSDLARQLLRGLVATPLQLRLEPTPRSRLR
jgi:hypothetical protein